MTSEELNKFKRTLVGNRCWKGYKPVKGKRPYSKGSCRKVRRNPSLSFSDFREFLSETLIPDLRESGQDATADDFETAVGYLTYGKDKKYRAWKKFIVGRLVPDLRASDYRATAKDFMTAIKFIDAGRRVVKNPTRLQNNGVRKKTWKIGEYAVGGIIEAMVNSEGNIVGIRNAEYKTGATISKQLFRWPLDKSRLEMHLNDLTTSYYADKIIQWLMAGSWELRSNPAELSDAKLQRAYKILNRDSRLREMLKEYDVDLGYPHPLHIRSDPSSMKILTQISKFFDSGYHARKLMVDSVQKALDKYLDETEEFLQADRRSQNRDLPRVTLVRG